MIVAEDEEGFTAFTKVAGVFIVAKGKNFDELLDNMLEAVNMSFKEKGIQYSLMEISLVSSQTAGLSLMDVYKAFSES